jgi:hypothetical protein
MSSPSHIRAIEPAVSVAIWTSVVPFDRSNPDDSTPCEFSRARKPYAWRRAIGTDRYRVYWLILFRPYSPSRLSAWSDGTTPVMSCMMIEALMYGFTPRATIEKFESPPPEIRSSTPKIALPAKNVASWSRSTPGTKTWARNRKTIRIPRT